MHRTHLLFTFVLCSTLPAVRAEHVEAPLLGQAMPACTLAALGDRSLPAFTPSTSATTGGPAVRYIDFWASWCVPCAKAFPFMNDLHQRYGERGLQIIAVNLDEEADEALAFLERHPANFAIGADPAGVCPRAFEVIGMPTSFVVDGAGIIRHVHTGFRKGEAETIAREIEALLEQQP